MVGMSKSTQILGQKGESLDDEGLSVRRHFPAFKVPRYCGKVSRQIFVLGNVPPL